MARDPENRLTDDAAQPERSSGLVPEEVAEHVKKRTTGDPDWLSMTTADPAFFLKESGSE